ncbi:MAG: hypothetical protein ORO03_07500, partial [Alphaproteobacteria bacterium]|nr:hypothetical protein [Alphaproteobacteria bacterium]
PCAVRSREASGVPDVRFRVVDSGRGILDGVDDSMTVGWLAHHVPCFVSVLGNLGETLREIRVNLEDSRLIASGFGWLRYVDEFPGLADSLSLTEFPLYINYLPAPRARYAMLRDCSAMVSCDVGKRRKIRGIAVLATGSEIGIDLQVLFDAENIEDCVISKFIATLEVSLATLLRGADSSG